MYLFGRYSLEQALKSTTQFQSEKNKKHVLEKFCLHQKIGFRLNKTKFESENPSGKTVKTK